VLGFPSLGVWDWDAPLVWGRWAPAWGVGPAGLLVRALCKYLDPVKKGSVWPSEPGTWGY